MTSDVDISISGAIDSLHLTAFRAELHTDAGVTVAFGGGARWEAARLYNLMIEERPGEAGVLAEAIGARVLSTTVGADGALTLSTSEGTLHVPSDERYEAWEVSGPALRRVVCMPGGDLAVWE